MNSSLCIADIKLNICHDETIQYESSFIPFITKSEQFDWSFQYVVSKNLTDSGEVIYDSPDYMVFQEQNVIHVFKERETERSYAMSKIDQKQKVVTVKYLDEYKKYLSEMGNSFYHSQWEKVFLLENRLLMHASCIDTEYGGILFSGPSGIGKSTQSDLWIEYEDARLINGDRPILWKDNGTWFAYGSPYAGSSKCHLNERTTIRCIVLLKQGKENRIRKISIREALQSVYKNLTVYTWDKEFVEKAFDLAMELVNDIPVYELSCLPDFGAVKTLKDVLEG